MIEELKPCPFCGGEAEILHYDDDGYLPTCKICSGMIEHWLNERVEAVEAWNRRVADER